MKINREQLNLIQFQFAKFPVENFSVKDVSQFFKNTTNNYQD